MAANVLYVVRPAVGGMAAHIRALCSGLSSDTYRITIACPANVFDAPSGVSLLPLPVADRISPAQDWRVIRALRSLARRKVYDLVHAHGLKAALLTALALRGRKTPPLLITLHNSLPRQRAGWRGRALDSTLRWLFQPIEKIIVVSQAQARDLQARQIAAAEKIVVIHNGVTNTESEMLKQDRRNATRARLGIAPHEFVVLMVARVVKSKGVGDLLSAAYILCNQDAYLFLIAGDGPDFDYFTAEANAKGLHASVQFLGRRSDVPDLLQAADVFALPSHSEGLPVSIIEAMAAERAVIATRVGGISELVEHGVTGLLVEPSHPRELADAINSLAHDRAQCAALGQAGRIRWKSEFTTEQMVNGLSGIYDSVLHFH